MNRRIKKLPLSVCFVVVTSLVAVGQIDVADIDDAPGSSGGQNCTSTHQNCTSNNGFCWQWNYDFFAGPACANSELVSSPSRDSQAREFDVSWDPSTMNATHGGAIFHTSLGTTNLDESDTHFSYDIWVRFTDLSQITATEFDLNQVIADGDTIIFGTQCYFTDGVWQYSTYSDGLGLGPSGSNWNSTLVACSKLSINQWHHLIISFHRASNCTVTQQNGGTCEVTYDSVYVDSGPPTQFTCAGNQPCAGSGNASLGWCPTDLGCLVPNFQLDWTDTQSGSMKAYSDLMTVNSPEDTQVGTPTFSPPGGLYSSAVSVTISTSTSGATICYTTDGTTPTSNGGGTCTHGTTYSIPVQVSGNETLKAIGSKDGIDLDSPVGNATYSFGFGPP